MILRLHPIFIARLLLCTALILSIQSVLAVTPAAQSLFYALPPNLGEMQVTPSRIPVKQTTLVTVTLPMQYAFKPETVILRRLDNATQTAVETLATFVDDGTHGDSVANDGIYTAQANFSAKQVSLIKLDALATFKNGTEQQQVASLWSGVKAKAHVSANQAFVAVHGAKVVFRDKNGRIVRDESKQTNRLPSKMSRPNTELVFEQQSAITSPDQNYVGIVGSIQPANITTQPINDEQSNIVGWEFRYQNVNGTLWSKTIENPERHFYLPDSAALISDDGSRVLLVETGAESDDEPSFTVYNQSGRVLLSEKLALYSLHDAQISANGQYLLFKGLPPTPKLDYENIIVISLTNPAQPQRWTETYRASQVVAEQIENNAQGGFDVWLNHHKQYYFPK